MLISLDFHCGKDDICKLKSMAQWPLMWLLTKFNYGLAKLKKIVIPLSGHFHEKVYVTFWGS